MARKRSPGFHQKTGLRTVPVVPQAPKARGLCRPQTPRKAQKRDGAREEKGGSVQVPNNARHGVLICSAMRELSS